MTDLAEIKYTYDNGNRPMISGTYLHRELKIKTPYRMWFRRMCEDGYEEGVDYVTLNIFVHRADGTQMPTPQLEHHMTIGMAQAICLKQKSEIGKMFRKRFIEKEEAMYRAAAADAESLHATQLLLNASEEQLEHANHDLIIQKRQVALQAIQLQEQKHAIAQQANTIHQKDSTIKKLGSSIQLKNSEIRKMKPKVSYCDKVLNSKDVFCITTFAKAYGWSGQRMNQFLQEKHIQYKMDGGWVLYQEYAGKGYAKSVTFIRKSDDGNVRVRIVTKWTQKGRELIDKLMREAGWKPKRENVLPHSCCLNQKDATKEEA